MYKAYDFFISFSNENINKVEEIVKSLRAYKTKCWFQKWSSKQNYIDEIDEGINNTSNFIVFLSNASISSFMVNNEISRAIYEKSINPDFKIVPVVIENLNPEKESKIKLFLGSLNWLYESQYPDYPSLALAIINEVKLELHNRLESESTYAVNKEVEVKRLEIQNRLFNEYARPYLDDIFAKYINPNILDIGCDDGSTIILRLENREYNHLVGLDINDKRINIANKLYGSNKNTFLACDVTSKDLFRILFQQMQRLQIQYFDIIHIPSVLLHLKDPLDVIKNLNTFLSPKGTIFIQDEDDGTNIVHPNFQFFDDVFYMWNHSLQSGDRLMGRKIALYLKEAGFNNIKLKSTNINSIDFNGKYKEELWDLYFNPEFWSTDSASDFDSYEAFSLLNDIKKQHSVFKRKYLNGEIFISLGVFFYIATKN